MKLKSKIISGNLSKNLDEWQKESNPWTVTLIYDRRKFTFPFWTGTGCKGIPSTFDAAYCVLSDANSWESNLDFESFCREFDYFPDSRKAEKIYNECGKTRARLKKLLGNDYYKFARMDEDTLKENCE